MVHGKGSAGSHRSSRNAGPRLGRGSKTRRSTVASLEVDQQALQLGGDRPLNECDGDESNYALALATQAAASRTAYMHEVRPCLMASPIAHLPHRAATIRRLGVAPLEAISTPALASATDASIPTPPPPAPTAADAPATAILSSIASGPPPQPRPRFDAHASHARTAQSQSIPSRLLARSTRSRLRGHAPAWSRASGMGHGWPAVFLSILQLLTAREAQSTSSSSILQSS